MRVGVFNLSGFFVSIISLVFILSILLHPPIACAADKSRTSAGDNTEITEGDSTEEGQPQDSEEIQTLEPVVISATKTPVPTSHLTSSVEVLTEELFKQRKIRTMVQALQLGQGLSIFQNGGPGGVATARIRGGTAQQTLVVLDGAIMNSPTLGSFNFGNLMVNDFERVEILRGAQSMVWGSDAIGGVINIRTKRGLGKPTAKAFFEYGSFNSIREGAQFLGQQGPLDFSFSLTRWDIAGFSAVNFRRGAVERDGFHNWQGGARLGLALPWEGRLNFNFLWVNGDRDIDTAFDPGFDAFKAKSTQNQFVYSGSYTQPITNWWEQVLTLSRQTEDFTNQFGSAIRNVETGIETPISIDESVINSVVNRIEWQHNFQVAEPLLLTGGYQFREQLGENKGNFDQAIISGNAVFGLAQLNLWDRVFATAGVRQDFYRKFGDATTYRVTGGYLHKETGTKIRGSYGTGFRVPTINDLIFPGFGNPDIEPEKSQSMDLGIEQALFNNTLNLSATYFWNRFRNLITSVVNNLEICGPDPFFPDFPGTCAANIGTATAKGWEFGLDYTLIKNWKFLKSLNFRAQYTYTLTRELEGLNPGTRLARWPVDQFFAVLAYRPIEPILLNLEARVVGGRFSREGDQRPLDSFTVWNLAATYDVNRYIEFYTRVENLFDERYEEVFLFGTPVRSIYGGIRVNSEIPLPF